MMKLSFTPEFLYFRRPFRIAHGVRDSTPIVLTRIEYEGVSGYGEASMPPYLGEDHTSCQSFLQKAAKLIIELTYPFDMDQVLKEIDAIADGNTAAKASIDIALHDLNGKLIGKPCWEILGLDKNKAPDTTYTIGIDEPSVILEKLKESSSFPVLKVKLNGEDDKLIIDTIRSYTDRTIAVDVNQGWKKKEDAMRMIEWLKDKNVLFIEQPLLKNDLESMRWLSERSPLPLYADESVQRLSDLDDVKDVFQGINIKLMKCTGMNEAYKMIKRGRKHGLKILIGCMSESSCGVSAAAQLSPLVDHADLDGPLLIKNDPFEGIRFESGRICLSDRPGIGIIKK